MNAERPHAALAGVVVLALADLGTRFAQSSDPSRAEIRRVTSKVFERSEFDESPSWIQRVLDWISRHLPSGSVGSGGFAGAAGSLIGYVLMILLVLVVVVVVAVVVRGWVRRPRPDEPEIEIDEEEPERTVGEWAAAAERFEAQGEWREALRCRYRELVGRLVDRGAVPPVPGRTTGELRIDVTATAPTAAGAFDEVSTLFELAWYADLPTGEAENRRVRELSAAIGKAPVIRGVDSIDLSGTAEAREVAA